MTTLEREKALVFAAQLVGETFTRAFGDKAAAKIRVNAQGWPVPRGPLHCIAQAAALKERRLIEDLATERTEKPRPFGEGSRLVEGRDGFSGPGVGGADLEQEDTTHEQ